MPHSCGALPLGCIQGNRDEETACCSGNSGDSFFVKGERARARGKCCFGRGVGRSRSGTGRRGGRRAYRIYGWPRDRPFLGCRTFALARAPCNTGQRRHRAANCRQGGDAVARRKASRSGWRRKIRAAGSGVRLEALIVRSAVTSKKNLTRRANHRHIFIIAEIAKARAGRPAAGFFIRTAVSIRRACHRASTPPACRRRSLRSLACAVRCHRSMTNCVGSTAMTLCNHVRSAAALAADRYQSSVHVAGTRAGILHEPPPKKV
jgi:hypothetical protein